MSDGRDRAEKEFLAELDALETEPAPTPTPDPPTPDPPRDDAGPVEPPGGESPRVALRRINALSTALTVVFVLVVLPATFALGGLANIGLCFDSCSDGQEAALFVGFALIPLGYVWACTRWVRRLRSAVQMDPANVEVASPLAVFFSTLVAIVLTLLALVAACFGLLGLFGAY